MNGVGKEGHLESIRERSSLSMTVVVTAQVVIHNFSDTCRHMSREQKVHDGPSAKVHNASVLEKMLLILRCYLWYISCNNVGIKSG